jgi:hypothetical protein
MHSHISNGVEAKVTACLQYYVAFVVYEPFQLITCNHIYVWCCTEFCIWL